MPPRPSARHPREPPRPHSRGIALLGPIVAWVLLTTLSIAAWALTGRLQRDAADRGLEDRAHVAADFTGTYLISLAQGQQRDAARLLNGATVTYREFDLFSAAFGYSAMGLLDDRGRVLLTWPFVPAVIGRNLAGEFPHLAEALRHKRIVVSEVYISPITKRPLVAVAVPYPTRYGWRCFWGGLILGQSRLGDYLNQAVAPDSGHAYYVDRSGDIVSATIPSGPGIIPLSQVRPALARSLSDSPTGSYRRAEQYWRYASAPVGPTGWLLVIETPERRLYAATNRTQRQYGIILLWSCVLGLGAALLATGATWRRHRAEQRLQRRNLEYARQAGELRTVNQELESFSFSVAHDLRAPLRAMSGYAEIVLNEYADRTPPEVIELVDKIPRRAARMSELIDALLSYSRLQRHPLSSRTVDVTALVRGAWDTLADRRVDRNIRFDLAVLPPCQGDPDLLHRVFINLLDNAIKFTHERPVAHIQVGAEPEPGTDPGGFTAYFVKDDGVGFDPAYSGQLFKPFHHLHPPRAYEGTGIGLSLVQRIVARHGGRISADSTPGRGATFTFTLPSA